ncbi:tyrosine-type recombinase/integrase [Bacillus cereus]|uniref:Site-specific recombinase phage integrase family n=1 Tax=Bacillus cereus TaxID=1396 RepID=A0A164NWG5_BACCE|nr:tyrosine-type recombinase/integrase [Bacillus cereus]KZD65933.1 site-specific recombinase phage integrase family [Bacillus cereus]
MEQTEFENTVQTFANFLLNKGRKTSTVKRYIYDIEDFGQWLKKTNRLSKAKTWGTFVLEDFEKYFSELKQTRNYSDKTLHRVYIVLNRLYQFLCLPSPLLDLNLIGPPDRALREEDFISVKEETRLKEVLLSLEGLTEKQSAVRPKLIDRNYSIVSLLIDYGLSLQELVSITMDQVHFENNTIVIPGAAGVEKTVTLSLEDKKRLYAYYKMIPEPVRPRYHSKDALFVAFDFNRNTYKWVYDDDSPKPLTEIAVQKMIRLEVARANLRKGISGQQFRNTYILGLIKQNVSEEEIVKRIGFKSKLSLKRYFNYAEALSKKTP